MLPSAGGNSLSIQIIIGLRFNKLLDVLLQIVPFKLRFKSKHHHVEADSLSGNPETAKSMLIESSSNNNIW
jgi:hypothetical protein